MLKYKCHEMCSNYCSIVALFYFFPLQHQLVSDRGFACKTSLCRIWVVKYELLR